MRVRVSPSARPAVDGTDTGRTTRHRTVASTAAAGLVVLAVADRAGRTSRLLAIGQSLTPHAAVLLPLAFGGGGRRPTATAVVATASAAALASRGVRLTTRRAGPVRATTDPHRVVMSNLLHSNPVIEAAADALLAVDPDVVVLAECTAEHRRRLAAHPLAVRLPYAVAAPERGARGLAVWARRPLTTSGVTGPGPMLDTTLAGEPTSLRVIGVHTTTPIRNPRLWAAELTAIGHQAATPGPPTLVVGDFNATWWHPPFRRLLDGGLVDSHLALRRALSASWPTGGRMPPFVRLDHALTGSGLVATDVRDLSVPGSDHRGLVVSVAAAR